MPSDHVGSSSVMMNAAAGRTCQLATVALSLFIFAVSARPSHKGESIFLSSLTHVADVSATRSLPAGPHYDNISYPSLNRTQLHSVLQLLLSLPLTLIFPVSYTHLTLPTILRV